ncbi:hypothetical protein AX774_g7 [Zancudomyces culisetae]|uniref:Transmembrane protein n=1 Tax=Zancudomyces culisetae TaxID=1213189 RepID=A0A1R1PZP9_ZANCU|nr:hypothetical protein AX774_g7 [Zancudomyces culisetae]|eukprot:OMH86419.1 hypothetical protein AX774_g7 [Zancudomyces culisetae]
MWLDLGVFYKIVGILGTIAFAVPLVVLLIQLVKDRSPFILSTTLFVLFRAIGFITIAVAGFTSNDGAVKAGVILNNFVYFLLLVGLLQSVIRWHLVRNGKTWGRPQTVVSMVGAIIFLGTNILGASYETSKVNSESKAYRPGLLVASVAYVIYSVLLLVASMVFALKESQVYQAPRTRLVLALSPGLNLLRNIVLLIITLPNVTTSTSQYILVQICCLYVIEAIIVNMWAFTNVEKLLLESTLSDIRVDDPNASLQFDHDTKGSYPLQSGVNYSPYSEDVGPSKHSQAPMHSTAYSTTGAYTSAPPQIVQMPDHNDFPTSQDMGQQRTQTNAYPV